MKNKEKKFKKRNSLKRAFQGLKLSCFFYPWTSSCKWKIKIL